MIAELMAAAMACLCLPGRAAGIQAEPEPVTVRCTCYLPTGSRTYDGTVPYEGICSSNTEHIGDVAMLWTLDGEWIGMFECRDIGGNSMLRNGTGIDIYRDTMDGALEWVRTYGDYVQVIWMEAEG